MKKAYFNWSGGKDSALALWEMQKEKDFQIEYLITTMVTGRTNFAEHNSFSCFHCKLHCDLFFEWMFKFSDIDSDDSCRSNRFS